MSTTDPLMNTQLGDYKIVGILGRGGMARVYRGYDAKLERYAAVKVIDANLTAENEEEYRQRFLREARSIARLNHPSIVSIYQFGEVNNVYYMAMAFIDGRDLSYVLRDFASQGKFIPLDQILNIVRDIASALDHAHHEGVIHRDVKPSNIMVTEDRRAILTDFGLALSVPEGTIGNTFGSAHYIAPEQAVSSANAVAQSDLYSLGVVLYQMMVGKVPFDDPSAMSVALKHLSDPPPLPSRINPRVTPEIEAVILKALEKEPLNRYASGAEMVRALETAMNLTTNQSSSGSSPSRPFRQTLSPTSGTASRPSGLDQFATQSKYTPPKSPTQGSTPSKSLASRSVAKEKPPRRGLQVIVAVVIILLLLTGAAALVMSTMSGNDLTPAPSTRIAVAVTESVTDAATVESAALLTDDPAEVVTRTATATATDEDDAPTSTLAPTEAEPSATPTAEMTGEDEPSPTEALVSPGDLPSPTPEPQIVLRYNDDTIWLLNSSDRAVNVSSLIFIQEDGDTTLTFEGSDWYSSAENLAPQACLQVWKFEISELPLPEECVARPYWRSVSNGSWFWESNKDGETFEVRLGEDVIATCQIDDGECGFSLRPIN